MAVRSSEISVPFCGVLFPAWHGVASYAQPSNALLFIVLAGSLQPSPVSVSLCHAVETEGSLQEIKLSLFFSATSEEASVV